MTIRRSALRLVTVIGVAALAAATATSAHAAASTPAPTGLHATGTTHTSISLAWDPSPDEHVAGYQVLFNDDNVVGYPRAACYSDLSPTPSCQVDGLAAGATYSFSVRASTADGWSERSEPVTATTIAWTGESPTAPTSLQNSYESPEDVAFDWKRSFDNADGYGVSYALFLDSSSTPATEWVTQPNYDFYLTFPLGVHTVVVRARDTAGNLSAASNTVTVSHCGDWDCDS